MLIDSGAANGYGTGYIVYRSDSSQSWSVLDKGQIKEIKTNFTPNYANASTGNHGYTNRCHIQITMNNGCALDFDVQDVSNQPTWTALGGTIAAITKSVQDISSW
jgi:hypothetical protein